MKDRITGRDFIKMIKPMLNENSKAIILYLSALVIFIPCALFVLALAMFCLAHGVNWVLDFWKAMPWP